MSEDETADELHRPPRRETKQLFHSLFLFTVHHPRVSDESHQRDSDLDVALYRGAFFVSTCCSWSSVGLFVALAGILISEARYNLCGQPVMKISNIVVGLLATVLSMDLLTVRMSPIIHLVRELSFSFACMLVLVLTWCWHYDSLEFKEKLE
jgi:hypothetical protein